jgi:hypothetical protein
MLNNLTLKNAYSILKYVINKLNLWFCILIFVGCQLNKNSNQDTTNENNFVVFNCQHGNYSFLASNTIDSSKIEQTTYENKKYCIYAYEFVFKGYIFSSSFYNLPINNKLGIKNETDILLDNMVLGAVNNTNGRLERTKKINYYKIQGKEFVTNYTDGRSITRLYMDENKNVYSLMVESTNSNEDFDNPIIQTFLNSFYLKELKKTEVHFDEVSTSNKRDELTCSDMEAFMVNDIANSDNFLQSNDWKMVQKINNNDFGNGYQYFIDKDGNHEQLIIYPEKKVVIYFPNESNYTKMLGTVKNNFNFSDVVDAFGEKQDLYTNDEYRVMINSTKKLILFAWGSDN